MGYVAITEGVSRGIASRVQCRVLGSEALPGGGPCVSRTNTSNPTALEVSSERRKGFPSETRVKRGDRVVGGQKELIEKLGRNNLCLCGSGRRFQALLHAERGIRWVRSGLLFSGNTQRPADVPGAAPDGLTRGCVSGNNDFRVSVSGPQRGRLSRARLETLAPRERAAAVTTSRSGAADPGQMLERSKHEP
jgi:hypothetical protein